MGQLDLFHLQDGFSSLVKQADPEQLPSFFFWLDLKVAHYKINGTFTSDRDLTIPNVWLQHATRRLFDKIEERGERIFSNGLGFLHKSSPLKDCTPPPSFEFDRTDAKKIKRNLQVCGGYAQLTSDASSPARFETRYNRDVVAASDQDLHRVMLKVPTLLSHDLPLPPPPLHSLEPLDFSRMERKTTTEKAVDCKDTVRSLLREALSKARRASPLDDGTTTTPNEFKSPSKNPPNADAKDEPRLVVDENALKFLDQPEEKNACPYCSKTFQYRSSFRRHVKIHQGIFSHACYVCGRKFTRKEHYVRHKCNRRPNKPNRGGGGQEENQDESTTAGRAEFQPETDARGAEDEFGSKVKVKVENVDQQILGEVSFFDDATDEEFSRNHESRRKSSTPRKIVIACDSVSDASDDDDEGAAFRKEGINRSLEFAEGFEDVVVVSPDCSGGSKRNSYAIANALKRCSSVVDEPRNNATSTTNGLHFDAFQLLPGSFSAPTTPEKSSSSSYGAVANLLNLRTGSYKVSREVDEEGGGALDSTKSSAITIRKQAKYLKLKNEARVVDGSLCFSCPHCAKTFHRSSNFSRHMRIHRGVYSYICGTCGRGFFRREHFQKHKCHRKSMSAVCDRRTKFELLHNGESTDGGTLKDGPFGDWPAVANSYRFGGDDMTGGELIISAALETQ